MVEYSEYIQLWKNQFLEIQEMVKKKDYQHSFEKIKELLCQVEEQLGEDKGSKFSFNHILETYYYAYIKKDVSQLSYTQVPIHAYYRMCGFILMHLDRLDEAMEAYDCGLVWNPVDLDIMFQLVELYKRKGMLEPCRKLTMETYDYCCCRRHMGRFYRNLGFYFVERKQLQLAAALYMYSTIYEPNENAERELDFIAKLPGGQLQNYTLPMLQEIIEAAGIPLGPNPNTLGITSRVGQIELDNGNYENAYDCFAMVYDLTNEEDMLAAMERARALSEGKGF